MGKAAGLKWLRKVLPEADRDRIPHIWQLHARPKQLIPITNKNWSQIFVMAGRGWGKTLVGSETVNYYVEHELVSAVALVGQTVADVRKVMILGESGIIQRSKPSFRPRYIKNDRLLIWPNGIMGHTYSADTPDQLRGPAQGLLWGDEPAKWRNLEEAFKNINFSTRKESFKKLYTGTPKPRAEISKLVKNRKTLMITGEMFENEENLPKGYIDELRDLYGGTRLWDEEARGLLLEDNPKALWHQDLICKYRVQENEVPELITVVVAVDPNASNTERSDEMGIVVAGEGRDGHHYILADYSMRGTPGQRMEKVSAVFSLHQADIIVYESNTGGDNIGQLIALYCPHVKIQGVPASRGKRTRAEPPALVHEKGRAHFVGEEMKQLEDQCCSWVPNEPSPDRMDAMVWAQSYLIYRYGETERIEVTLEDLVPDLASFDSVF